MTKPKENWVEQPCAHCGKPSGTKLNTRSELYAAFVGGVFTCPGCASPGPTDADERAFDEWWKREMGDRMKGSRYLARNAWMASRSIGVSVESGEEGGR